MQRARHKRSGGVVFRAVLCYNGVRKKGVSRLKIAIVDDDEAMHAELRSALCAFLGDTPVFADFTCGENFLQSFTKGAYDLILLDIFMGRMTGVEVAREVRGKDADVRIVFGTTSNEFASESYEVGACYYLQKPFRREAIRAMLDRLNLHEMEKLRTVTLPGDVTVPLADILYADFAAHKVTLHCRGGRDVAVRAPYSKIEPILCANPTFFSPCKGVVVNFLAVSAQENGTFILCDGARVPISRRRAKEVTEAYSSFLFDRMRKDGEV